MTLFLISWIVCSLLFLSVMLKWAISDFKAGFDTEFTLEMVITFIALLLVPYLGVVCLLVFFAKESWGNTIFTIKGRKHD